jgi:hypothetical protein
MRCIEVLLMAELFFEVSWNRTPLNGLSAVGASPSPPRLLFSSLIAVAITSLLWRKRKPRPSPAEGTLALSARRCGDQRNAVDVSIANATDSRGRGAPGSGRGSNDPRVELR